MNVKPSRKTKRRAEVKVMFQARRLLLNGGIKGAFGMHNRIIFAMLGERLGEPWNQQREHGYDLARRFVGVSEPIPTERRQPAHQPPVPDVVSPEFLQSYAWRKLRMEVLKEQGARCACCGRTPRHGVAMHVDHIKPRRRHPELALDKNNLQILCEECNHGKGNWDETDWREPTWAQSMPMWHRPN